VHGRRPAEDERGCRRRRRRKDYHPRVQAEACPGRRAAGQPLDEGLEAPLSDDEPREAADDGQRQALDRELPHESKPVGADGHADAHLAAARERPREHDRRDVGACQEQEHGDRDRECRGRRPQVAHADLAQGPDEGRHDALLVAGLEDRRVGAYEILLGLGGRHARLQSTEPAEGVGLVLAHRVPLQGDPQPAAAGVGLRLGREHADDRVRTSAQPDHAAQDLRVAAKAFLPERVREERNRRPARAILVGGEHPSDERPDPENVGQLVRRDHGGDALGAPALGEVQALDVPHGQGVELPLFLPPHVEVGEVDAGDLQVPARRPLVHEHESVRLVEGERPEEEPIDEAEDGDVGGHAQRQHGHDEQAGQALAAERPQGIADVGADRHARSLPRPAHGPPLPAPATPLARPGAGQVDEDRRPGFGGGEPPAGARRGELVVEELLHLPAMTPAEQRREQQPLEHAVRAPARSWAAHHASPARRMRARATLTSAASRAVSAFTAARPFRVSR
jgi:hypothetical protein